MFKIPSPYYLIVTSKLSPVWKKKRKRTHCRKSQHIREENTTRSINKEAEALEVEDHLFHITKLV